MNDCQRLQGLNNFYPTIGKIIFNSYEEAVSSEIPHLETFRVIYNIISHAPPEKW